MSELLLCPVPGSSYISPRSADGAEVLQPLCFLLTHKPDRRTQIISLQEAKEKVCPLSLVSAKGHLSILSHIFHFPFFFEHFDRLLISFLSLLPDMKLYWPSSPFGTCDLSSCPSASQELQHELSFLDLLLPVTLVVT